MKLENTMVIIADLGELKVFKVKKHEGIVGNELKISYSLELINDLDYIAAHKKISELVSDKAGNFKGGNLEDNKIEDQIEKRTIKDIATDIDSIVNKEKPKQLFLAFPKEANRQLLDTISQETKNIIVKNVKLNLIKEDKNKILSFFD